MAMRAAATAVLAILILLGSVRAQHEARAIFAGGCFWSIEHAFEQLPGVRDAVSGFTGGPERFPTYDEVSKGLTGHLEAVEVFYDPTVVAYRTLVDAYWRMIDPTDADGQACDRAPHYRAAVFVADDHERAVAERSRSAIDTGVRRGRVVTPVRDAEPFWPAAAEHQDFYRTQSSTYALYDALCQREQALARVWGGDGL